MTLLTLQMHREVNIKIGYTFARSITEKCGYIRPICIGLLGCIKIVNHLPFGKILRWMPPVAFW